MADEQGQTPEGGREIVMVGLAHPADRAVFDFFGRILAVGDPPVSARLTTDAAASAAGSLSIGLRSEALDAVRLAATTHLPGAASSRERYAEAAGRGAARPGMPTLSIECVLCDPLEALRSLGEAAGIVFSIAQLEAARRGLPELQERVGRYLHPLCYLDACGGSVDLSPRAAEPRSDVPIDVAFLSGLTPGAPVLVVAKSREQALSVLGDELNDLDPIAIGGTAGGEQDAVGVYPLTGPGEDWPDVRPFQPHLLYLHDMGNHPDLPAVFDWALNQMAPGGWLAGREVTAGAMHELLAGLTRRAGGEFDFILDGSHWAAVPPAQRSA